jgi:GTP diphosphokinase / guanosine-3',5'-bis(diphosphate) 3'-diphosphatase
VRIMVDGIDASTLAYSLADCCNPVLGDDIFAYISSKSGLKIHRTTCSNAEYLQAAYAHRVKKAEWINANKNAFVADLQINGMDDMGVIQHLSEIITNKLKINMRSFSMSGGEGHFEGKISVLVHDKDQLNTLIQELKKLEEVQSVIRLDGQ